MHYLPHVTENTHKQEKMREVYDREGNNAHRPRVSGVQSIITKSKG